MSFRRHRTLQAAVGANFVETRPGRMAHTPAGAVAALLLIALCGCASNHPIFTERTTSPLGVVTERRLEVRTIAIWPASTSIEKQKATLGKTFSLGQAGLHEDGGSTNIAMALEALTRLVGALKP